MHNVAVFCVCSEFSGCSLIDDLVFYPNADLAFQVEDTLAALQWSNVLAFESKLDVLMEEHCPDLVQTMRRNELDRRGHHHDHGRHRDNVYDAVFRGELLHFATAIVEGEDLGDDRFVITMNGGILQETAEGIGQTVDCPLIQEMLRNGHRDREHRAGSPSPSPSGTGSGSGSQRV